MILDLFRILLIITLIIVIVIDVPVPEVLTNQVNQLIIAILIILIIVAVDEIVGFLCGLIFLVIYFKFYQKKINSGSKGSYGSNGSNNQELNEPLIKAYNPFNMNNEDKYYNYSYVNNNNNKTIDSFIGDTKPVENSKIEKVGGHYVSLNERNNSIIMPYISTELLDKAQNNIYDNNNYYTEIKKMDNAYGIQGLNSDQVHYEAFDKTSINNNYK